MTQRRNILNNVAFVNIQIVLNRKAASVSREFQTFDVRRNKLLARHPYTIQERKLQYQVESPKNILKMSKKARNTLFTTERRVTG